MRAGDSGAPDTPSKPDVMSNRTHHVQVTAAWRAEMDRRQAAYAARRQRHTEAFLRGEQPEPSQRPTPAPRSDAAARPSPTRGNSGSTSDAHGATFRKARYATTV